MHLPSSPHAPDAQSESSRHARHVFASHTGVVPEQSLGPTHPTQLPVAVSHTGASVKREHWLESVHESQTSVVMLHTGAMAAQPAVEQLGTSH
jgi:hypothetical protein